MTRIGVDVGGTFTDVIVIDGTEIRTSKTPSTPDRPDDAVIDGLRSEDQRTDALSEVTFLGHGTTVATNAVLEGETAETALVTTDGMRDVLEIGRQDRPDLYDLDFDRPEPIVPRDRRFTVEERIDASGDVVTPLDEDDVRQVANDIPDSVEAVAVCTLFSFEKADHERRISDLLAEEGTEEVVVSSDVLPEFREFERTSTTVLNAALRPIMEAYLARLDRRTKELGVDEEWVVMQSNGGLLSADRASETPVNTLLSGPAAGVKGAQYLADAAGFEDIVTMDMGGTSTDVSLVDGGDPTITTDGEIDGRPIGVPTVDIHTIGAGGGSIAWIDAGDALRVGPKSAGADPGPAVYDRGGTAPTVTDAQAVLGRIDPEYSLSDDLSLDVSLAREAIERDVADPLNLSVEEAAQGILRITIANMQRALRVVSVERGYDPREFTLVAFGGAGPLHAATLAEEMSIPRFLVPQTAGVLSALGLTASDLKHSFVTSNVAPLSETAPDRLAKVFDELIAEGRARLESEGIDGSMMRFERSLDLRYQGQTFSLNVSLSEQSITDETVDRVEANFHDQHDTTYGHSDVSEPVELVNVRVDAVGEISRVELAAAGAERLEDAVLGTREVWFEDGFQEATVYDHQTLPTNAEFEGPAIVQANDSTTTVLPEQRVTVDENGTLVVTRGESE